MALSLRKNIEIGQLIANATAGSLLFVGSGGVLDQDNAGIYWNDTSNFLGLGTASPASRLHLAGNISAAAWTTSGIGIRSDTAVYTDTSSSGTVSVNAVHALARPTLVASSATTYTTAATLYLANSPLASTNVTITNPLTLYVANGNTVFNGNLHIGTSAAGAAPAAVLQVNGNLTQAAWTTNGVRMRLINRTYTDTSSTGTIATVCCDSFLRPTFATSNTVTYTSAATVFISNAPLAGTNVTITNPYALLIDDGDVRMDARLICNANSVNPTAAFTIGNGGVTASAWGLAGIRARVTAGTFTDSSSSGTVTNQVVDGIARPTLVASSATVYTNSSTWYVANSPLSSTNVTQTNSYALWVDDGISRLDGAVQIGCTGTSKGALAVNGGIAFNTNTQSGTTYTVVSTDHLVYLTNTAARTITLPAASTFYDSTNTLGQYVIILDGAFTAATANITINRAGSDTFVGGGTSITINQNGGCVKIYAVATDKWAVIT